MALKNTSLKQKVLITLVAAGLIPLLVIGVLSGYLATNALQKQAFNQLITVRDSQKQQIENYFQNISDQIETFSDNRMIVDAVKSFRFAYKLLPNELDLETNLDDYRQKLSEYYRGDFATEYRKRTGQSIDTLPLMPQDGTQIALQYQYIAANSHPLGEKHRLDSANDGTTYAELHARYHPVIRNYLEKFGYYDIFLVDPDSGKIIYSVFKELDYTTSLTTGPYKDTNFARAFRQALAGDVGTTFLQDFAAYTPSYEAAASFIASPIHDQEQLVGVLVFQMPVDRINAIMGIRSGLGASGQSYLLGQDGLMRSQSPLQEANTILAQRIESDSAQAVIDGDTGYRVIAQPSGNTVLSAYAPVAIKGVRWGLLAEKDENEAFAAVSTLLWSMLAIAVVTAVLVVWLALGFARGVYRQLGGDPSQIEQVARSIADGDLQQFSRANRTSQPIGVYASMLKMRDNLTTSIEQDVQRIVDAARAGDLGQRVELDDKQGFYRQLAVGINDLVEVCENIVNDTLRVFEALSRGSLDETYDNDYRGSFERVKDNANATIATLRQVIEGDIQGMVDAAIEGNLSQRIDLDNKQGFFADISQGMNQLVGSVERIFADASTAIDELAKGNLDQAIGNSYQGDFEILKGNINASIQQLDGIVTSLRHSGDSIGVSSSEVNDGAANLSARTEQQASALEQTAASMEQLTGTVKHTADNSAEAETVASDARSAAIKGGNVMQEATAAMEEINQSSQQIAEIIGVIDEIAFQTNLLALNASVEAARAGEQGKGFAVVATEVRNLAGRSATAAKEIKELINDSVAKVANGVELVRESSNSLDEIVDRIGRVGTIIQEIASASNEQAAGIEQVNQAEVLRGRDVDEWPVG